MSINTDVSKVESAVLGEAKELAHEVETEANKVKAAVSSAISPLETAIEDCFQRHFGGLQSGQLKADIEKFYKELKSLVGLGSKAV